MTTMPTTRRDAVAAYLADLADRLDPDVFDLTMLDSVRMEFDYLAGIADALPDAVHYCETNAAAWRDAGTNPTAAAAYDDAARVIGIAEDVHCAYCGTFGHTFRVCPQTPTD
jgi:hypothetical protein